MYEHLRKELMTKLDINFSGADINIICTTLDEIMKNYEVTEKCTQLVLYEDKFPRLAEIYLQSKKLEGISIQTDKLYRGRLRIFFERVNKLPADITTNDIRCFLAEYKLQTGISDRSLDKFRQIINGFYTWCADEEYISKNPCKNIKEIKYEAKPRRALTRMELEKLRRECKTKRDLAIVDTLFSTGCRVTELVNMKVSDINVENKSIHIIGKGNKHNTCYFNANAQISLSDYIGTRKEKSDYLFTPRGNSRKMTTSAVEAVIRKLGNNIGLEISPHILRHTFATLSLQAGMPLTQVQKMLGHVSSDTTLIYAEVLQEDIRNSHIKYVV